jgi:hypothetical protein
MRPSPRKEHATGLGAAARDKLQSDVTLHLDRHHRKRHGRRGRQRFSSLSPKTHTCDRGADRSDTMRPPTIFFAILSIGASNALAQGASSLPVRQSPIGHRQPTASALPPVVRGDRLSNAPSRSAPSQPADAPLQAQTTRTRGGGPPILQVGPSCEAAGRGAVVLGRNKEACLADETDAQNTLKQNWSRYTATDKTICSGMTTTGGPASYVELVSCLEILRDAKSIEATDPLGGDTELDVSRADVAHAPRVRNRRADRGHRGAL